MDLLVWWPSEPNILQLEKIHVNRQNLSRLRKCYQFYNTHTAKTHGTTKYR